MGLSQLISTLMNIVKHLRPFTAGQVGTKITSWYDLDFARAANLIVQMPLDSGGFLRAVANFLAPRISNSSKTVVG